jgi:Spy/CpxP family protein refolding chaperone
MAATSSAHDDTHQQPLLTGVLNMNTSIPCNPQRKALRLAMAVAAFALAAGFTHVAWAGPFGGHGGHGGHEGHERGGPRQLERMLDEVKATPEQRAQIKQITEAARADMAAQREAGRKLHDQNRALFAQPNVDARAAETLRQQMLAQHDQASKRMLQMKLDISRVLSPEQRAQISDRMKKREEMMQRHRQERESLGKPRT